MTYTILIIEPGLDSVNSLIPELPQHWIPKPKIPSHNRTPTLSSGK